MPSRNCDSALVDTTRDCTSASDTDIRRAMVVEVTYAGSVVLESTTKDTVRDTVPATT